MEERHVQYSFEKDRFSTGHLRAVFEKLLQNVEPFSKYTSLEALVLLKYHRGKAGSI